MTSPLDNGSRFNAWRDGLPQEERDWIDWLGELPPQMAIGVVALDAKEGRKRLHERIDGQRVSRRLVSAAVAFGGGAVAAAEAVQRLM